MAILEHLKRQISGRREAPARHRNEAEPTGSPSVPAALPKPVDEGEGDTPYTHGLDKIYALENVDVRTIRPMKAAVSSFSQKESQVSEAVADESEAPQSLLDLGPAFTESLESFRLKEPIQVLQLSNMATQGLLAHGFERLQDVVDTDRQELVYLKGLGQGHVDELEQKLQRHFGGSIPKKTRTVDFVGLVRSLLGTLPPSKLVAVLEPYNLGHLFPISPAEQVELRHLSDEKRRELIESMRGEMATEGRRKELKVHLQRITAAFVRPWIGKRLGVATRREVQERIERVSGQRELAGPILRFLGDYFFDGGDPLRHALICLEPDLFAADHHTKEKFQAVVRVGKSYLYAHDVWYSLENIESLIEREMSRRWIGFPDGFVANVLRKSSAFHVYKGTSGKLEVRG